MEREYTVRHRVYNGFGFVGINEYVGIHRSSVEASKAARSEIAGNFETSLESMSYRYVKK